jgi:hypothetical protein
MLRALDPLSCLVKGDLVFQLKGLREVRKVHVGWAESICRGESELCCFPRTENSSI